MAIRVSCANIGSDSDTPHTTTQILSNLIATRPSDRWCKVASSCPQPRSSAGNKCRCVRVQRTWMCMAIMLLTPPYVKVLPSLAFHTAVMGSNSNTSFKNYETHERITPINNGASIGKPRTRSPISNFCTAVSAPAFVSTICRINKIWVDAG